MQLHILQKVEALVAKENGSIVYVGGSLFVAEYEIPFGSELMLQKALINYDGSVNVVSIFKDPVAECTDLERMVKLISDRDDAKEAGRGFNVDRYTESELIEMEFIDSNIKFNLEMLEMALGEVNVNQLTTAEAVQEVVYEMNSRKKQK